MKISIVTTTNNSAETIRDTLDSVLIQTHQEEMNRQVTGRIATYNFSPTPLSEQNLKDENAHG